MGIFALALFGIMIGYVIWFVLKFIAIKVKVADYGERYLRKKLLYSGFLRYFMISNLELTVTAWGFFTYLQCSEQPD